MDVTHHNLKAAVVNDGLNDDLNDGLNADLNHRRFHPDYSLSALLS